MSLQNKGMINYHINMLTANCEYSRINRENLPLPIQIKLSKKPEMFAAFFLHFWNLH